MNLRRVTSTFLLCILLVCAAHATLAQTLDISSGGQPTITGAVNGSVTGSSNLLNDLLVTINFGEVSPANANSIMKVVVPIGIRSNQPYQVSVSLTGLGNANPQALQASDIGFGAENIRIMGNGSQVCTQSSHIFQVPFNNDPASTVTTGANGRATYQSSLADLSGSTVILSGPRLSKTTKPTRQSNDGYIFDAIFAITPQFFATGASSATLTFTISAGPNVPC
jgi:hypothetical protein